MILSHNGLMGSPGRGYHHSHYPHAMVCTGMPWYVPLFTPLMRALNRGSSCLPMVSSQLQLLVLSVSLPRVATLFNSVQPLIQRGPFWGHLPASPPRKSTSKRAHQTTPPAPRGSKPPAPVLLLCFRARARVNIYSPGGLRSRGEGPAGRAGWGGRETPSGGARPRGRQTPPPGGGVRRTAPPPPRREGWSGGQASAPTASGSSGSISTGRREATYSTYALHIHIIYVPIETYILYI